MHMGSILNFRYRSSVLRHRFLLIVLFLQVSPNSFWFPVHEVSLVLLTCVKSFVYNSIDEFIAGESCGHPLHHVDFLCAWLFLLDWVEPTQ